MKDKISVQQLIVHRATSFREFVDHIEKYQKETSDALWFRGCGNAHYSLLPSLYRHKTKTAADDIANLEQEMLMRFEQRSIPMRPRPFDDDWDRLFFMQHYRIPTRLLDWTENPFIALYFAVMSADFTRTSAGRLKFDNSIAIWILNPVIWNRHALAHQSYDGGVLTVGDDALNGYQPNRTFDGMNKLPIALHGAYNSARIVAQRGVFTISGQEISSMEQLFKSEQFPTACLTKIEISPRYIPTLRQTVLDYGITESAIFPDLEGLALEIRRTFSFEE